MPFVVIGDLARASPAPRKRDEDSRTRGKMRATSRIMTTAMRELKARVESTS